MKEIERLADNYVKLTEGAYQYAVDWSEVKEIFLDGANAERELWEHFRSEIEKDLQTKDNKIKELETKLKTAGIIGYTTEAGEHIKRLNKYIEELEEYKAMYEGLCK